jgi:hypothetical protein
MGVTKSWPQRLPAGLPRGRLVAPGRWDREQSRQVADPSAEPVLWVTNKATDEAPELWQKLYAEREQTGLYPLLLHGLGSVFDDPDQDRPWRTGELEPVPPERLAELDADPAAPSAVCHTFSVMMP